MQLASKSRESVAGAVSLMLGLTVAAALKVVFLVPPSASLTAQGSSATKPTAVRVRAKADAIALSSKVTTAAAIPSPRPPKAAPAVREVAVQSTAAPVTRTPPAVPPRVDIAPTIALEQPAPMLRPETTVPDVQPLPAQAVPPKATVAEIAPVPIAPTGNTGADTGRPDAPPDDYAAPPKTFIEQPGGEVLVLGLLLDSKGHALDVQIYVPSYDTVSDNKYAMAVLNTQSFTDINPPIPPGESRWIETRMYYPKQTVVPNILP